MIQWLYTPFLVFLLSYQALLAHKIDSMEFALKGEGTQWILESEIDISYMLPEFRNEDDTPPLTRTELSHASEVRWAGLLSQIEETLKRLLHLEFAGQDLDYQIIFPNFSLNEVLLPDDPEDTALILTHLTLNLPEEDGQLIAHWKDDMEAQLIITRGEREPLVALTGDRLVLFQLNEGSRQEEATSVSFFKWLKSGFHHVIPLGLDHILFILGLFFAHPKLKPILWQSLLFTIAHSVTLVLTVTGWLSFPSTYIELLIALSIAWIGLENLWIKKVGRARYLLVFFFGLLHGLGFASVLGELLSENPKDLHLLPLAAFNIGVEFAQVSLLLAAWLLFIPLRNLQTRIQFYGSLLIAIAGIFWCLERSGLIT